MSKKKPLGKRSNFGNGIMLGPEDVRNLHALRRSAESHSETFSNSQNGNFGILESRVKLVDKNDHNRQIRRHCLTRAQLSEFLRTEMDPHLKVLWLLMSDCGLRISEALSLEWQDLISERNPPMPANKTSVQLVVAKYIKVIGKGRKPRILTVPERLSQNIHIYYQQRDEYWNDRLLAGGNLPRFIKAVPFPYTRHTYAHVFKERIKALSYDHRMLTPHSLRHTYATLLLDSGLPPHIVSISMGHSNLATTMRYAHLVEGWQKRINDALSSYDEVAVNDKNDEKNDPLCLATNKQFKDSSENLLRIVNNLPSKFDSYESLINCLRANGLITR